MANSIQIQVTGLEEAAARCRRLLDAVGDKAASAALSRAMNRALVAGRAEATRIARRAYTAPARKLWNSAKIYRVRPSTLDGQLVISGGRGVSLIHFKAIPSTPTRKGKRALGVSVQVKKGGPRTMRSGAFVMQKKQGGFGIFVRNDVPKGAPGRFTMLMGPSPVQALERREDQERVAERIREMFERRLPHELDALLEGVTK